MKKLLITNIVKKRDSFNNSAQVLYWKSVYY